MKRLPKLLIVLCILAGMQTMATTPLAGPNPSLHANETNASKNNGKGGNYEKTGDSYNQQGNGWRYGKGKLDRQY